ncbi:hypothetical protein ACHAXT_011096 [Thalassiosira profunda]
MTLSLPSAPAAVRSHASPSPPSKPLPPVDTLFVWDFDWTVVNCNSDEFVPAHFLGNAESTRRLHEYWEKFGTEGKDGWHECISAIINDCIREKGCNRKEIQEVAASMPYLEEVRGAIENVGTYARCGQMIISDGNDDFIHAFLEGNGLAKCFCHGVETNFAQYDGDDANGGIQFSVVHQSKKYGGHSCPTCPTNLCKTQVLRDILSRLDGESRPRVVYVGDGANDACPGLRVLEDGDVLFARGGFKVADPNSKTGPQPDAEPSEGKGGFAILSVLKKAEEEGLRPKCRVSPWETGSQLRSLVRGILDKGSGET